MRFELRAATAAHAETIASLLGELGYPAAPEAVRHRLQHLQSTGSDHVLVAAADSDLLGVVSLHWTSMLHLDAPVARITSLVVREHARGHGVGRALVEAAADLARAAGCSQLELTTGLQREDAHAFYAKLGFVKSAYRFRRSLVSDR